MKSVSFRDEKSKNITALCFFGGCGLVEILCIILVLLCSTETILWWYWIIFLSPFVVLILLIIVFVVLLINCKVIVSEQSLTRVGLKKKNTILKDDILLIADIPITNATHYYVVYPKSYDKNEMEMHFSIYTPGIKRSKSISRDSRLLMIYKSKRLTKILEEFGYSQFITIIDIYY